jgi:hypothetical protein
MSMIINNFNSSNNIILNKIKIKIIKLKIKIKIKIIIINSNKMRVFLIKLWNKIMKIYFIKIEFLLIKKSLSI